MTSETRECVETLREIDSTLQMIEEANEHLMLLREKLRRIDPDREAALFEQTH